MNEAKASCRASSTEPHRKRLELLIICLLSFSFFVFGIWSWKFAWVGDEWAYFDYAKFIADRNFMVNPFGITGVFGIERVQSSIWQAIFIKASGGSHVGWRFANTTLVIPTVILLYFFLAREFKDRITTLVGCAVFGSSFYLANFYKIGYTHSTSLFFFVLCLNQISVCREDLRTRNFILLGLSLGLSFYHYIGPIFGCILFPYLVSLAIVSTKKVGWSRLVVYVSIAVLVYVALLLAGVVTNGRDAFVLAMEKAGGRREYDGYYMMVINVARNFILYYKNYDYNYNHFVAGPYVDFFTAGLLTCGLLVCFVRFKHRAYRDALLAWVMLCISIGVTNPYTYAPTTRGIFFIPFAAVFASIGAGFLCSRFKVSRSVVYSALVCIFLLNIYKSQIEVFNSTGYNRHSILIGKMQLARLEPVKVVRFWQSPESLIDTRIIRDLMPHYGVSDVSLVELDSKSSESVEGQVLFFTNDRFAVPPIVEMNGQRVQFKVVVGVY